MSIDVSQDLPTGQIRRIAFDHGARKVRIFGSRARGEALPDSDLDLLVEFESGRSLLDAIALEQDLGDLLGFRVQVVTLASLSHIIRDRVLAEAIEL